MLELATITSGLMSLLLEGGNEIVKKLFNKVEIKGKEALVKLWHDIFSEEPEAYSLANNVVKQSDNEALQQQLKSLLEQTLNKHPELLHEFTMSGNIRVGNVTASNGSIATGVNIGGSQTISNKVDRPR